MTPAIGAIPYFSLPSVCVKFKAVKKRLMVSRFLLFNVRSEPLEGIVRKYYFTITLATCVPAFTRYMPLGIWNVCFSVALAT